MKKIKLDTGKLRLQKEKVINLSVGQMRAIQGGLNTNQPESACLTTYTCTTDYPGCQPPANPVCLSAAGCSNVTGTTCQTNNGGCGSLNGC